MSVSREFWAGKRVLITGHTGFKGSWLSLWLQHLGAEVYGLALEPCIDPALFTQARVDHGIHSEIGDIRDFGVVLRAVDASRPEILFHLAAQPLVRLSYSEPLATYATNVLGTAHVLEAVRQVGATRAVVNVTSDKCYENREWDWPYRENEPMGGSDPYSSSKGCAELVANAYRRSYFAGNGVTLASARAGNVIGGGDWSADRLVPDVLRAFEKKQAAVIRNPNAVRPWQHVLASLSGYLMLAERLCSDTAETFAEGWNFGPGDGDARPVRWIVERMAANWGQGAAWRLDDGVHPKEAGLLKLDSSKARSKLGWSPQWTLSESLNKIMEWHMGWLQGLDAKELCLKQIAEYAAGMNSRPL